MTDVVNPYYELGVGRIVQNAEEPVHIASLELSITGKSEYLMKVDEYLRAISWDANWERMDELMHNVVPTNQNLLTEKINE